MDRINQYLATAVDGIRDRRTREDVRAELEDHIMEKYEEYKACGYNDDEAEERTVSDMGSAYDLQDKMGKLHSFMPHIYFNHAALFLLFGLLYAHFSIKINVIDLFPSIVGIALISIAFFRFYSLGTKSKIAFWLYTVGRIIFLLIGKIVLKPGFSFIFDNILSVEGSTFMQVARFMLRSGFSNTLNYILSTEGETMTILLLLAVVSSLVMPTSMTLLCLDLMKKDEGRNGLKWVIGIEWAYLVPFLLALTGIEISSVVYTAIAIGLIVELVIIGKFARRAKRYDWDKKKGLHIGIPIFMAAIYVIVSVVKI